MARALTVMVALVAALGAAACAGVDSLAADSGGALVDAGTNPDPAWGDSSTPLDATTAEGPGPALLARDGTGLAGGEASQDDRAACYGFDDDGASCNSEFCRDVRSCCVGDGACCAAVPRPSLEGALSTAACTENESIGACAPGVTGFGSPFSFSMSGDIAPGGDLDGVAGVLSADRVDLVLHRLRLSATFEPPTECTEGCPESVALGVTEQTSIGGPVRPVAALVYSGSQKRMALLVGDTPVARWDDVMTAEEWVLDLRPDGTAAVFRGEGADPVEARYRPRASVGVVVWGRTVNPAGREVTRLSGVTVDVSLCDVAAGWRDRAPLAVTLAGGAPLRAEDLASAPSVVDGLLAFEMGGAIYFAEGSGPGAFQASAGPALAADPTIGFMSGAVGDPELVATSSGYSLYFTATTSGGTASIGRQDFAGDGTPSGMPVSVLTPQALGADDVREPTVEVHSSGELVMAVRASVATSSWLALARSADGAPFTHHRTTALEELTLRGPQAQISRFDQDEAGDPSLVIHNGAWKLYYTGRRGTRESLGLLVSDDLVDWRPLGEVFPAGDAAFEAVGVRQGDVAATASGLAMVYVGTNGVHPTLAGAGRLATDIGARF